MGYQQNAIQNFCRTVADSYSFDNRVCGLDELADGVLVDAVSVESLQDSGRFKRDELAARLADEPNECMTLYMDTKDQSESFVLRDDGFVYSTSRAPKSVAGSYVFMPKQVGRQQLTQEEKKRWLEAA